MEKALYFLAAGLIKFIQALPLLWIARLGRCCGALAYWVDGRHRRVALRNLTRCFGKEMSSAQIRALARENFRRLGENYCSAIRTAAMPREELASHVEFVGMDKFPEPGKKDVPQSCVVAIGHFGNFELYARLDMVMTGFQGATTYRALRQPSLDRLFQSVRERSGCRYFERRTQSGALKTALAEGSLLLGLLSDQHGGDRGVAAPFFGQLCSTSPAPAVLALRYHCPLYTGICYRVALGRWRIEAGDEIPTHEAGQPRSLEAITTDINRAFEAAVRRDPANWFWVHNRWKPFGVRSPGAMAASLVDRSAEKGSSSPLG